MNYLQSVGNIMMKLVFPNFCLSCNKDIDHAILCNPCLDRLEKTTLDREERLQNMENAFVTSRPLKGLKVGIIDDALTTGTTMSGCTKALKNNGAVHVTAVTLATRIIN